MLKRPFISFWIRYKRYKFLSYWKEMTIQHGFDYVVLSEKKKRDVPLLCNNNNINTLCDSWT